MNVQTQANTDEYEARLILFSAIKPGHKGWGQEIQRLGATLVVEAAHRSGSLRTARDASDLMRPVMANPGTINSPMSQGCHRLIAERAAEIVSSTADALEFVGAI